MPRVRSFFAGQAPKYESQDKIAELEAEKGDAKIPLVPCIMALINESISPSPDLSMEKQYFRGALSIYVELFSCYDV